MIQIKGDNHGNLLSLQTVIGHRKRIPVRQTSHLVCLCEQSYQCHIEQQKRDGIAFPYGDHVAAEIETGSAKRSNHQIEHNQNCILQIQFFYGHEIMDENTAKQEKRPKVSQGCMRSIHNIPILVQRKENWNSHIQDAQDKQDEIRCQHDAISQIPVCPMIPQQKEE